MEILTRIEELILLAVLKLGDKAYGLEVRLHLCELMGSEMSVGAVYVPLARLKERGFLDAWDGEPTEERGGRAKRFYRLTGKGVAALREVRAVQERAWEGLPDFIPGLKPSAE